MSEIVSIARSSSNAVRSHGFPVLETGNLSFPDGRYAVGFRPGEDRASFVLEHRIEGAPLISRLLQDKIARYVCAVSSPMSSYRQTHVSSTSPQRVQWDTEDLGEPPLFTPMIVSGASCELRLDRSQDGVHEIWHDKRIVFEKGSRIALGPVVQLRSSILQLLSFHANRELEDGRFVVVAEMEEGFRFRVDLNPRLHAFLKYTSKDSTRDHIMTHIVTACLSFLQRDFVTDDDDDGGWKSYRNLLAFADFLKDRNLPHWTDEEFRPEQVSTALYPHTVPQDHDGEEA